MDLPFVLDVAIGLLLIFLILSLLVTEVQEIITTVLQWRAQHLREAIEVLLAGGVETRIHIKDLVDKLYDDPLIKNINHEAKGVPGQMRKLVQWLLPLDFRNIFGGNRTTGPSYMVAETFTASFIEQTGLVVLVRKLIEVRLENYAKRVVGLYDLKEELEVNGEYTREVTPLPDDNDEIKKFWNMGRVRLIARNFNITHLNKDTDFKALVDEYADIVLDFKNKENDLKTSIARMEETLNTYIENCSPESPVFSNLEDLESFVKGLKTLKKSMFGDKGERALASDTLCPSLLEFAELLDQTSQTYQEVQKTFKDLTQQIGPVQPETQDSQFLDRRILEKAVQKMLSEKNHEALLKQVLSDFSSIVWQRTLETLKASSEKFHKKLYKDINRKFKQKINILNTDIEDCRSHLKHLFCQNALYKLPLVAKSSADKILLSKYHKSQVQRRRLIASILNKLDENTQIEILAKVINSLNYEDKFTCLEVDRIGLIDRALDRIPREDRYNLFNYAFDQIKSEGEVWSREYELKQRSLYSDYETYKRLHIVLSQLPGSIKESFAILARRAQTRIEKGESDINQFRKEVATWFDQSMERAAGVYKRNAKGVSILLGISIAFILNVDTLYIVSRLSNDENLRRVITESAIELTSSNDGNTDEPVQENAKTQIKLDQLRNETDRVLRQIVLPIGWNPQNLDAQLKCSPSKSDVVSSTWTTFYQRCLTEPPLMNKKQRENFLNACLAESIPSSEQIPNRVYQMCSTKATFAATKRVNKTLNPFMRHIQENFSKGIRLFKGHLTTSFTMILGWFISGFAISMGAAFWFDLLNQIINIRQTGSKPEHTFKAPPQ